MREWGGVLAVYLAIVTNAYGACGFSQPPETLYRGQAAVYRIFHDPEGGVLLENYEVPADTGLLSYRSHVESQVDPEPYALLKRQRAIFEKYGMKNDLPAFDEIIERRRGKIAVVGCVESLLMAAHLSEVGTHYYSEFGAFILTKGQALKIYFFSGREAATPDASRLNTLIERDRLEEGWSVLALLHNHPFGFGNSTGDIGGTTIPSAPDEGAFLYYEKLYGITEAWITNGFSTLKVSSREFKRRD